MLIDCLRLRNYIEVGVPSALQPQLRRGTATVWLNTSHNHILPTLTSHTHHSFRRPKMSTGSFGQIRSKIRALETRSESLLSQYSGFTQTVSPDASEDETRLSKEIDDCLNERQESVSSLSRVLDSDASAPATKLHQVQRHKELLQEHRAVVKRIQNTIQQERNKTNLLSTVRSDIDNYHASSTSNAEDYMLSERSRIDNSHNIADSILSQAYETRDEFMRQRANLANVQRRVVHAASQIPGLNTLIAKVNTRKKRDSLILASLITLCILFLFFIS